MSREHSRAAAAIRHCALMEDIALSRGCVACSAARGPGADLGATVGAQRRVAHDRADVVAAARYSSAPRLRGWRSFMTGAVLESVIGVFARAPDPGQTKTRLIPRLGADAAAPAALPARPPSVETALASDAGPVELWCAPSQSHPFFQELATEHRLRLRTQGDGDLGERMADAFRAMLGTPLVRFSSVPIARPALHRI